MGEAAVKVALGVRLRERRHRRDALPGRRVLLPRDEHAPAGRALRHRGDHRPRPRRRAAPRRGRASRCRSPRTRSSGAATRSSAASTPRTRRRTSCRRPAPSPGCACPRVPASVGTAATTRATRSRSTTTTSSASSSCGRPIATAPSTACCARSTSSRSPASRRRSRAPHAAPDRGVPRGHPLDEVGRGRGRPDEFATHVRDAGALTVPRPTATVPPARPLVEQTVPVEVDGRRYSVKVWLPEAPAGTGGRVPRPGAAQARAGRRRRRRGRAAAR